MVIVAYPYVLFFSLLFFLAVVWYRARFFKPASYVYPLAPFLYRHATAPVAAAVLYLLRFCTLLLLAVLVARPQLVDVQSTLHGEGVDIILALDVSGSMQCVDDPQQGPLVTRLELAKKEAWRFVDKRHTDSMGLVLFGREAVSRVPLTLDKKMLKDVITEVHLGVVPDEGTVLAKSIVVAASRLKNAKSKSKVIILLTDGQPSPEDSSYQAAIEIAKELGIKIYTIGVGGDVGYFKHPQFGLVPVGSSLNRELLQFIARETGGRFFEARQQEELRAIYDQIDRMEKTDREEIIFSNYYDIFIPFVWLAIGLVLAELILSTWVWFVL